MKYHLKSILKSKLTWTFFLILLISNLYTTINLEVLTESEAKKIVTHYRLSAMTIRDYLSSEKKFIDKQDLKDPNYINYINNYFTYREWLADNDDKRAEFYSNRKNLLDYNKFYGINIQEAMAEMNYNADPEEGRPFAEDVFKQELKEIRKKVELEKLPYNSHDLRFVNNTSESEQTTTYNAFKVVLNRYFELILKDVKELNMGTPSPWTLLIQKVSIEEFSAIMIPVICLIYSTALVMEDKRSGSIKLVEMIPKKRKYVILHYYSIILLAVLIILLFSFGIPMLILGLRHDFRGLNNPIFVYPKGFTSFNIYEHIDEWVTFSLGKYSGTSIITGYNFPFPSDELVFYPLWKVIILSLLPSAIKILFYTLLGLSVAMCLSKKTFAIVVSGLLSIVTIVSQVYLDKALFNPFSVPNGWDLAICSTQFSWLRGVTVLSLSWIILLILTLFYNQKRDFAD